MFSHKQKDDSPDVPRAENGPSPMKSDKGAGKVVKPNKPKKNTSIGRKKPSVPCIVFVELGSVSHLLCLRMRKDLEIVLTRVLEVSTEGDQFDLAAGLRQVSEMLTEAGVAERDLILCGYELPIKLSPLNAKAAEYKKMLKVLSVKNRTESTVKALYLSKTKAQGIYSAEADRKFLSQVLNTCAACGFNLIGLTDFQSSLAAGFNRLISKAPSIRFIRLDRTSDAFAMAGGCPKGHKVLGDGFRQLITDCSEMYSCDPRVMENLICMVGAVDVAEYYPYLEQAGIQPQDYYTTVVPSLVSCVTDLCNAIKSMMDKEKAVFVLGGRIPCIPGMQQVIAPIIGDRIALLNIQEVYSDAITLTNSTGQILSCDMTTAVALACGQLDGGCNFVAALQESLDGAGISERKTSSKKDSESKLNSGSRKKGTADEAALAAKKKKQHQPKRGKDGQIGVDENGSVIPVSPTLQEKIENADINVLDNSEIIKLILEDTQRRVTANRFNFNRFSIWVSVVILAVGFISAGTAILTSLRAGDPAQKIVDLQSKRDSLVQTIEAKDSYLRTKNEVFEKYVPYIKALSEIDSDQIQVDDFNLVDDALLRINGRALNTEAFMKWRDFLESLVEGMVITASTGDPSADQLEFTVDIEVGGDDTNDKE